MRRHEQLQALHPSCRMGSAPSVGDAARLMGRREIVAVMRPKQLQGCQGCQPGCWQAWQPCVEKHMQQRRLIRLSDVIEAPVRWLWLDRVPLGAISLLE